MKNTCLWVIFAEWPSGMSVSTVTKVFCRIRISPQLTIIIVGRVGLYNNKQKLERPRPFFVSLTYSWKKVGKLCMFLRIMKKFFCKSIYKTQKSEMKPRLPSYMQKKTRSKSLYSFGNRIFWSSTSKILEERFWS